ncbi:MAG: methylated-DNA--[protein]-cysteine S-methyltransferase, partial [Ancrocorticia sp.]
MEYSKVTSPIGELLIVASDRGLTQIAFESEGFEAVTSGIGLPKEESESQGANAQAARAHLLARAGQQLTEYFAGERREFDVPLDFTGRSGFQLDVQKY